MQRINVVGVTGSGKTTMARRLSAALQIPHIELDALYWAPNWEPAPVEVFRARVADVLQGDAWVIDGNYSLARDLTWQRVDTVVWLDYRLALIMVRLLHRTLRRSLAHEELWNENYENLSRALLSRDSILLYALQSFSRRRRTYQALFADPAHAHLEKIRLPSPRAARRWLAGVENDPTRPRPATGSSAVD
ncbi:MAG: adenylate kinase [Anaerolineae bacterium]|nr:adenylate kinase [Anaerolineae bacterium]